MVIWCFQPHWLIQTVDILDTSEIEKEVDGEEEEEFDFDSFIESDDE